MIQEGFIPRISIISPTWSAQDLMQVLGRIHRAMGKSDCIQQIIYCKGTIEESIGNVIKNKINNIRAFNDGDKQLKKDNMEVILHQENVKKEKKQEEYNLIYDTLNIKEIYKRINWLEKQTDNLKKELKGYILKSDEYKECEYRLNKSIKEFDLNKQMLKQKMQDICDDE